MKRIIALLAAVLMLVGMFAGAAQAATPDITLSSVGSRYTNTDITIKGYLSGITAGSQMVVVTQRNVSGTWTTLESKTFTALGLYTMTPQKVAEVGTVEFRTQVTVGSALLATSNVISVVVKAGGPVQPPPPPPPGSITATIGGQVHIIDGTNINRTTNTLIRYTPAKGLTTGTNAFGFEAAVVNNVVVTTQNGIGNMPIPTNGYVLSGHGTSRSWLAVYATVGATVTVSDTPTGPGGDPPAPVVATRVVDGTVTCQTLRVEVLNQQRTNTWRWDGTTWVDYWGPWTTVSTGTRVATAADCINEATVIPSDALLPDIRIKNLDKCGAGDLAATGGTCFKILNPNPNNPDFPALNGIKMLKFPVITLNVGAGPAEVIAERTSTSATDWKAWQTFYRPDGGRQSVLSPTVKFYYAGDGHNHWHFKDFDNYWIEDMNGNTLRTAEKHGYCLEDNTTWSGLNGQPGVPANPVYIHETSCGLGLQSTLDIIEGLSRGWGDTYTTSLPDQGIDIGGLPDGRYKISITADAVGAITEANETNNTASMEIQITGNTVTTYPATATGGLA